MPEENGNSQSSSRSWTQATQLMGIAFSIPWTLLAMTLFGNYLDKRLGTQPWLMLVGLLFGLIGGFFEGAVLVRRMGK
jgi:F0F1-type ATP synthase assembly protein I